jgi:hypothetical protein
MHLANEVEHSKLTGISAGYIDDSGKRHLLCEDERPICTKVEKSGCGYTLVAEWKSATEMITLSEEGLELSVSLKNGEKPFWKIPMLLSDGKTTTELIKKDGIVSVRADKSGYSLRGENLTVSEETVANRNGIYRIVYADSEKIKLSLKFGFIEACVNSFINCWVSFIPNKFFSEPFYSFISCLKSFVSCHTTFLLFNFFLEFFYYINCYLLLLKKL